MTANAFKIEYLINKIKTMTASEFKEFIRDNSNNLVVLKIIGEYLRNERNHMYTRQKREKAVALSFGDLMPLLPTDDTKANRKIHQLKLFKFLRQEMPPSVAVEISNLLQSQAKHMIFDPEMRKLLPGEVVKYGEGDVLHFIGIPGLIADSTGLNKTDLNPLYANMVYPIPDYNLNTILQEFEEHINLEQRLKALLHEHVRIKKIFISDRNEAGRMRLIESKRVIDHLAATINYHNMKLDPAHWSESVEGQERPMKNYVGNNLTNLHLIATNRVIYDEDELQRPAKFAIGESRGVEHALTQLRN